MVRRGIRRFDEPRRGVSQLMVDAEARELRRELDSYLLHSNTELSEKISDRQSSYRGLDESIRLAIGGLPERDRLAIMCILLRDLDLVLRVYVGFLQDHSSEAPTPLQQVAVEALPFSEWLFEK